MIKHEELPPMQDEPNQAEIDAEQKRILDKATEERRRMNERQS